MRTDTSIVPVEILGVLYSLVKFITLKSLLKFVEKSIRQKQKPLFK